MSRINLRSRCKVNRKAWLGGIACAFVALFVVLVKPAFVDPVDLMEAYQGEHTYTEYPNTIHDEFVEWELKAHSLETMTGQVILGYDVKSELLEQGQKLVYRANQLKIALDLVDGHIKKHKHTNSDNDSDGDFLVTESISTVMCMLLGCFMYHFLVLDKIKREWVSYLPRGAMSCVNGMYSNRIVQ